MSTDQHTGDPHGSYPALLLACYSVAQEMYAAIEQQQQIAPKLDLDKFM
jgi:hypothetical protein